MSRRFLVPLGALAAVIALGSLAPVPAAEQAPSAKAKTWTGPRTPDGHPDLQGIWDFRSITPLERPDTLGGKQVLSEEEVAAVETQATQRLIDRDRGPRKGDTGSYNAFWVDNGTAVRGKRSSLIVDPPDGKLPPFTPDGQKRVAARTEALRRPAFGPEDRSLGERCILGFNAGPPMVPGAYNQNVQLLQAPGYVVLVNEMVHNARIVPMDGRPHGGVRQWNGDSRGRWEGNTLVVETRNFTNKGTGALQPRLQVTDENLHLVERFTRVDADTLLYEYTVTDPTTWTKPWTASIPMAKSQDQMYEYACHEGNYGLLGILEGARADDKAAAAKKGSN
jgi:hypothetical protein